MRYAHNLLSGSRLVATPVVALLAAYPATRVAALLVSVAVGLTDWLDGPLARRSGAASPFGALFDMTSDKVFLCTLLIVLAAQGSAPVWAAAIIASRELLVLFLRVVAAQAGRPLPIATFGKLKTFMLYFLVPLALAGVAWQAVWFLAIAASVSACGSLMEYVVKMRGDLGREFFCAWAARRAA
ncbi:MAG: CDP-alcohol phosphatidyltransferase family protein [Candidatus Brocadiia bacterium]